MLAKTSYKDLNRALKICVHKKPDTDCARHCTSSLLSVSCTGRYIYWIRTMTRKRAREESATPHPARANSKAAKFNLHVLKRLEAAVKDDPEVDLTSKLPLAYSDRLIEMRSSAPSFSGEKLFPNPPKFTSTYFVDRGICCSVKGLIRS